MMVILSVSDDGYFDRIWWWLFQKRFLRTKLDIYAYIRSDKLDSYQLFLIKVGHSDIIQEIIFYLSTKIALTGYVFCYMRSLTNR